MNDATLRAEQDALKKQAAVKAVEYVECGMVIGLGTGSTSSFVVEHLGDLLARGELRDVVAVPTSNRTREAAERRRIPIVRLDDHPELDLAIDGADEVDGRLNLVKGRGGALLREKMIAVAARRFVVVVDETKLGGTLGTNGVVPVDVVPFSSAWTRARVEALGCRAKIRVVEGRPFVTDDGNHILDCTFPAGISDAYRLAGQLGGLVGVVEHGLFLDLASAVVVAGRDGVRVRERAV